MDARRGHVGQSGEDIGEPSLWVDAVHFGRLCRTRNYAERAGFPQLSF